MAERQREMHELRTFIVQCRATLAEKLRQHLPYDTSDDVTVGVHLIEIGESVEAFVSLKHGHALAIGKGF